MKCMNIASKCGVDWDTASEGFVRDGRIGHSHMQYLVQMVNLDLEDHAFLKI